MPKALKRKLKATAKKLGLSKKKTGAYVYGNKAMQSYLKKNRKKK